VLAPAVVKADDPEYTRKKVREFLHTHTAYELIPESGKVVLLDCELPVRQAFHALHEQGIASAPVWDAKGQTLTGARGGGPAPGFAWLLPGWLAGTRGAEWIGATRLRGWLAARMDGQTDRCDAAGARPTRDPARHRSLDVCFRPAVPLCAAPLAPDDDAFCILPPEAQFKPQEALIPPTP
jgi:hypothetical protein